VADDFGIRLQLIAATLKAQADGALFRDLTRAMRDGVEPVQPKIREELRPRMPDPYADELNADLDFRVSVSVSGRNPGVTLHARPGRRRSLKRLDRGSLDHPLFGDRDRWYKQPVVPGFFTRPCQAAGPDITRNLETALQRVSDEIDRKAP